MDWKITLPDDSVLEAAFTHPQLLRNPNPVTKSDGGPSAYAAFRTLAAVVTVADDDWPELARTFQSVLGITSSALAGDYVAAISQSLATLDASEGNWADNRADLELSLSDVKVQFELEGATEVGATDSYYGYTVRAPGARWDRFVDDDDLVAETKGRVRCEQLFHDVNGAQVSRGRARWAAQAPVSGFDYYSTFLNAGVGRLSRTSTEHTVQFHVTLQVTAPGDDFIDLITDPTMLIETDPRMATKLPELRLLVAAGTVDQVAEGTGLARSRVVQLLKQRGLAPEESVSDAGEQEREDATQPFPEKLVPLPPLKPNQFYAALPQELHVPFMADHIRREFVPKNRLAAAFVSLVNSRNIPRVPYLVEAMDPMRRRRLAAGLGLARGSSSGTIACHLMERVFVKKG